MSNDIEKKNTGKNDSERNKNNIDKEELLSQLRKCGRFLYHRFGNKCGQDKILKILAEKRELSQKELQDMLGIQSGSISEIINKLERRGLLYRTKDETDKRMAMLSITEEGMGELNNIATREVPDVEELFSVLSAKEQEELSGLIVRLNGSWEERYGQQKNNSTKQQGEIQ